MNVSMHNTLKETRFVQSGNSNQRNVQGRGSSLYEKVGNVSTSDARKTFGQSRLTSYDAYCSMSAKNSTKVGGSDLGVQAVDEKPGKVENDQYTISIYQDGGIKDYWCVYNKETGRKFAFDPKLTSFQTDPQTYKKYLIQSDLFGGFVNAWGIDASLEGLLEEFMGVDGIQSTDITENYMIDRDPNTGIVSIKKKGAEGNGGSLILEDEEQVKKLEELADIYLDKYPSVITSKNMALTYAKLEVLGYAVRDDAGILTIGIGGMTYMNHQQPEQSWGILYSAYDNSIYAKIKEAFVDGTITGNLVGDYEKWTEWLTEKKIDFELTTVEEDLERLREENYSEWHRITSSLQNT